MILTKVSYAVFVTGQSYQRGIFAMVWKWSLHHQWVRYSKLMHQKQLRKELLVVFTFD